MHQINQNLQINNQKQIIILKLISIESIFKL